MANIYAKEVFENKALQIQYSFGIKYTDEFEVVIDGMKCEFSYRIKKDEWSFFIRDNTISIDNEHIANVVYYSRYSYDCDNKRLFPEFDEEKKKKDFNITIDVLTMFFQKIFDLFETLVFDKKNGKFNTKDIMRIPVARKCCFGKFIETDTCSVCLDETLTKTPCGHTLCFPCWQKLNKSICPECRGDISFAYNC